ncbi:hypothetical protein DB354_20890 [Opitutus sp. ER46]|nr:hypothetical protein DB354_20890 [Opitutus sp. ER46]
MAHEYAIGVGISFLASLLLDYRGNYRNLVRADVMAISSLYFLTLFEFLAPQPQFDDLVTLDQTRSALVACLWGFTGLAVGRHFAPSTPGSLTELLQRPAPPRFLITLFSIALFGGFLHMLLAVNFNVFELVDQFMAPRFSQPWGRGKFGDWKALLGELGMILYLVPPLAGIVLAKRAEYSATHKLYISAGFAFTLFYGFTSGTRNVIAAYLATFLVAYAFTSPPNRKRELIWVGGITAALMLVATVVMLEFRNIGFRNYLQGYNEIRKSKEDANLFVDYNLYVIGKLTDIFPKHHDYLGLEIPYLAIIRPIPRAAWPGKPEGLSLSIEDAVGVEGLTLASSFVGEAYISGGNIGVLVAGVILASVAAWWNKLAHSDNSGFGNLVFASGFFAMVISMRSLFVFTTAILPTVAALVLGNWLIAKRRRPRTPPPT